MSGLLSKFKTSPEDSALFSARKPWMGKKGFTLVEAMVATAIFALTMMGVYACIIKAYQLSQATRYSDQARSVLLSFVDQFERLETVEDNVVRPFFTPASPTGIGLKWPDLSNEAAGGGVTEDDDVPQEVTLGDADASITAYVTRAVYPLDASSGSLLATNTSRLTYIKAPGYMLMGVFTISYTLPSGKTYNQRLAAVRAIP